MGIKIWKVLGYGLTDIKVNSHHLDDPRINLEGIIANRYDIHDRFPLESYISYLDAIEPDQGGFDSIIDLKVLSSHVNEKPCLYHPDSTIHWNAEYGIPNVMCFAPLTHQNWVRYDDTIDWIEETYCAPDRQVNKYKVLPYGIYPWTGLYEESYGPNWTEIPEILEGGAKELGFTSYREAVEHMAPMVPDSIANLLKWGKAFTDNSTIWQLRPMIYTYWS